MPDVRTVWITLSIFLVTYALSSAAAATTVKILASAKAGPIAGADADDDLQAFYADLGADSSLLVGTVTAADLSGVDLFVVIVPDDAFTTAEIDALEAFVLNGGRLLVLGEQDGFAATENTYLDTLLFEIGSAMSLDSASLDSGLRDTMPGQIIAQPGFTDGVLLLNYGNVNSLSGLPPASELLLASDLSSVFAGFEGLGNGDVVVIADVNLISNLEDSVGNDNHVFFANLADIATQSTSVKILTSVKAGTIAETDADNDLNTFYLSERISSSLWPGEVSDESLAAAELLVVMLPDDAFTPAELAAMGAFLSTGGRVLFMGEQETFAAAENAHINDALLALGSGMALGTSVLDSSGLQDTVVGQILSHPYNDAVGLLNYGNVNSLLGVPTSTGLEGPLFLAKDLSSVWGGVEQLPSGGTIILLGDVNLLSRIEESGDNDNHVFFLNIAPTPSPPAVPLLQPFAVALLAASLACVGAGRRRTTAWRGQA